MSLFSGINTARTGLSSAQTGVNTTSHNISNAENKEYTRQRVVQESTKSLSVGNSLIGTGTKVESITRVHNEFVYTRYQQSSERNSYISTLEQNLEEISNSFPDMEGVGIKNDLDNYLSSWSGLAQDPSSNAQKEVVVASADNLATSIKTTYERVDKLHKNLDEELVASIDEVNRTLKEIASLNSQISGLEANGSTANDLRDKRDAFETRLSKLVGAEFVHGNISDSGSNLSTIEAEGIYSVMIGGVAVVSGTEYHELSLDIINSKDAFHTVQYDNRDGTYLDMSQLINRGKVGAILELRGDRFDENGEVVNGLIPDYKEKLNLLAQGIIEETNSIYAESASQSMQSKNLGDVKDSDFITEKLGINEGNFNLVVYDKNGKEVSKRVIHIDSSTTFNSEYDNHSLMEQLTQLYDDNGDNSLQNDFASQFKVSFFNEQLVIKQKNPDLGYTFGIEDNGTNFAGATGLNRFFDGDDASNISINRELKREPHKVQAHKTPVDGDNGVADAMNRLQNENWTFHSKRFGVVQDSITGIYNDLTVDIASQTEAIKTRKESVEVQFKKISKVDIDTEMTNLMKYQTAYSAAGKVITTLDRMIDTLLGIKQ